MREFIDKYNMTIKQNIFLAKRNIIDYIWKSANLEGIAVTFPETERIYEGLSVQRLKVSDIISINNLKNAWHFILDSLEYTTDYNLICEINRRIGANDEVYNTGYLRRLPVRMSGTNWVPVVPAEFEVKNNIQSILHGDIVTNYAIILMLYCMRTQLFMDGNKRTSMLAANHIMIRNGKGIISIPLEEQDTFRKLLIDYYETGDMYKAREFIYDRCIDGIHFDQ